MNLDLASFQARVQSASEIHMDEISQQAGIIAVAVNDPSKLKEVLPQRKETTEANDNEFERFMREQGGGF